MCRFSDLAHPLSKSFRRPWIHHFFRATFTEIHHISINHNYLGTGKVLPMKHIEKNKVCLCQKGEEWSEIAKGNFFFLHRNFSPCTAINKRLSIAINLILKVDFVTTVLAVVCGYAQPRRQALGRMHKNKQ